MIEKVIESLTQTQLMLWHMVVAFLVSQLISYWVSRRADFREDYRDQFAKFIEETVPMELAVRSLTKDKGVVEGTGEAFFEFQRRLDHQIIAARRFAIYAGRFKRREIENFIRILIQIKNTTKDGISERNFDNFSSAIQSAVLSRDRVLG